MRGATADALWLGGDVPFHNNVGYLGLGEVSMRAAKESLQGPLWENIPAVQNGDVHETDPDHADLRRPTLGQPGLDDLEKCLAKG